MSCELGGEGKGKTVFECGVLNSELVILGIGFQMPAFLDCEFSCIGRNNLNMKVC